MFARRFDGYNRHRPSLSNHRRQILQPDPPAITQRRQGAQHVTQLPHVPGPGETQQRLAGGLINQHRLPARLFRQQEVEQLRFVTAFAQRRQRNLQPIEPVIQILAEAAVLHPFQKITVSRADDPHVDRLRLAANRHHLPIFQHS